MRPAVIMKNDTRFENLNNPLPARSKSKVLLVAGGPCSFKGPCRKALIRLGFEVKDFDYRSGLYFRSKIIRGISRKIPFARGFIKRTVNRNTNRRFKKAIDGYRPDILFCLKADTICPEVVRYARDRGALALNWYAEIVSFWENIKKLVPVYDFFFLPDHYVLRKLKENEGLDNCFYLPFAADIDENSSDPFENREELYDISMIATYSGSMYANRDKYLTFVKDLGLNIWGSDGWRQSSLSNYHRGRAGDVMGIYRKTKIVPNIHYNKEPAEGTNLRPFEAMGSGALLISDDIRADMFRLFKEGEEFVSFREGDNEKFRELCKYYLGHPEERIKIARRAYESILAKHTYLIRIKEMLKIAGG